MNLNNLKDKKIALVFGQSIEGCGVTRNGSEMWAWCKKNNLNFTIFSYDERTYNRRDAHEMEFVSFKREDIEETVKDLNTYDMVLFNSYPSNKFNKESIMDFYHKLVKNITTIKVGFMHELNKANIDKIPYILGIMNEMDIIYNFSEDTWFSNTIAKILPSKKIGERIKKFTMWFNFDDLDEIRERVQLEDKDCKLMYLGRWTTMKDPRRVLDMGKELVDNNIGCKLLGIERSIGAKFDIFEHPNCIDMTGKEPKYISEDACVPVHGTYVRNEGMEEMAKSLFGCSFYRMPKDPKGYGDRMEYTQIEIIAVGSIPVFDKHWGENNFRRNGQSYLDTPYSAIYSDKENLQETIDTLIKVSKDKELQNKIRETSYKIVKEEFDANIVLPEMFNYILSVGKDTNKFKNEEKLIKTLIHEDFIEEFMDLYNKEVENNEIPVLGIRELYENNILSVLDGKKEKEIKVFKKSRLKK